MSGSFSHSFVAAFPFSFVSNAKKFFIHSLNRFVLKNGMLVFMYWVPFSLLAYKNIPFKCLKTGLRRKPFWFLCRINSF